MTLYQVWGVTTPGEAEEKLQKVRVPIEVPANLEEWCLSQVGEELYELFVKGYTAKQWMCDPKELPASIIKRLPIRLTYDDGYFDDVYQGIPVCGYTQMVENMLVGIPVELGVDFFEIEDWRKLAKKLIYTGPIDRLFGYRHGRLGYRTLDFRHEVVNGDFQGIAQVNYADKNVPWTRITEHKHFEFLKSDKSVVTWETPVAWQPHSEPYYPLSDAENQGSFQKYMSEAKLLGDVVIGGRLGSYQYLDMHQAVGAALKEAEKELSNG
jgi:UDP-galactopyranose mutase